MTPQQCNGCPWHQAVESAQGLEHICNRWQEVIGMISRCGDRMFEKFIEPAG